MRKSQTHIMHPSQVFDADCGGIDSTNSTRDLEWSALVGGYINHSDKLRPLVRHRVHTYQIQLRVGRNK